MTAIHPIRDDDDFRAGVAFAAHAILHTVNAAHGHTGYIRPGIVPKACCREAVTDYAVGIALGFEASANAEIEDHDHEDAS